jgi:predicted nucleic acid-binding protein
MRAVYADSYYFVALLNSTDAGHGRAAAVSRELHVRIVTTEWVLTEVGDAMADPPRRASFLACIEALRADPMVEIVPASEEAFASGLKLYASRGDKDWSLTDCISFVLMQQQGLTEALTADHHFEQAGFKALLR